MPKTYLVRFNENQIVMLITDLQTYVMDLALSDPQRLRVERMVTKLKKERLKQDGKTWVKRWKLNQ